ncbi:MAG: Mpv17/PMP22 family protein [Filifactoraceae bacterium]
MKKGDLIWGGIMAVFVTVLLIPSSRTAFIQFTETHKYIGGFSKFAILASMGSLLADRLRTREWRFQSYFISRAIIWGFIGMWITLMFGVFDVGIGAMMKKGLLPFEGSILGKAFFISLFCNFSFAPCFMMFHNGTDAYFDLKAEGRKDVSLSMIANKVDWSRFFSFTLLKAIPLFWIPAHTITFMLPGEYRVLFAAMLSIALGILLSMGKK